MPIIALAVLLQIACAVHCVRRGAGNMWLMVIIFLSVPGCLAYIVFEVLPLYSGHRTVRRAKAVATRALDPERNLRAAREALDTADTVGNRIAIADAFAELEQWNDAIPHYEVAVRKA